MRRSQSPRRPMPRPRRRNRIQKRGTTMKSRLLLTAAAASLLASVAPAADYTSTVMTRDLKVPAALAWQRIGGFCTLDKFIPVTCAYKSGTGGVGTVRAMSMNGNPGGEEV